MKKALLLAITFFYLLSSIGIAVNKFYCCGILKSISIASTSPDFANCKMPSKKKGCCDNVSQIVKVKDQHLGSGANLLTASPVTSILSSFFSLDLNLQLPEKDLVTFNHHAPPDLSGPPLLILNCTFRI